MNKKKPLIRLAVLAGAAKLIHLVVKSIENGSNFLDSYVSKAEKINVNSEMCLDEDGYYSIVKKDEKPFKVLQITDLHIGGGYLSRHEDLQALGIMGRAIKSTRPDLIVITGDLACPRAHISMSRNNINSFRIITDMLENIGIPYAITFGNHDTDGRALYTRRDILEFLITREHCLMVENSDNRGITGFSNYIVKLKNSDGRMNSVIFLMDSNEYISGGRKKTYDYIHDDQVKWYGKVTDRINSEEGRKVSSFVFFHIPIKEYKDAWNASVNAENTAVYYYGTKDENISCSKYKSKLFQRIVEKGCTKGVFCGHDHLNDFSVEYKGVRFTYGQSIDCILYAKNLSEHKGATLLKIHKDGTFEIKGKKHR